MMGGRDGPNDLFWPSTGGFLLFVVGVYLYRTVLYAVSWRDHALSSSAFNRCLRVAFFLAIQLKAWGMPASSALAFSLVWVQKV